MAAVPTGFAANIESAATPKSLDDRIERLAAFPPHHTQPVRLSAQVDFSTGHAGSTILSPEKYGVSETVPKVKIVEYLQEKILGHSQTYETSTVLDHKTPSAPCIQSTSAVETETNSHSAHQTLWMSSESEHVFFSSFLHYARWLFRARKLQYRMCTDSVEFYEINGPPCSLLTRILLNQLTCVGKSTAMASSVCSVRTTNLCLLIRKLHETYMLSSILLMLIQFSIL